MRRSLIAVVLFAACARRPAPVTTADTAPGAPTSQAAVEKFLAAVRAQDLQAMAVAWGTKRGPVRDDRRLSRQEIEQREMIMVCHMAHNEFKVLDETRRADLTTMRVALTKGTLTRETTFTTVQGPGGRWYVLEAQLEPLRDLCASPPGGPAAGTGTGRPHVNSR